MASHSVGHSVITLPVIYSISDFASRQSLGQSGQLIGWLFIQSINLLFGGLVSQPVSQSSSQLVGLSASQSLDGLVVGTLVTWSSYS